MRNINEFQRRINQELAIENLSFDIKEKKDLEKKRREDKKETYKPPSAGGNWKLHFASGLISGPVSRTITAPIDRMKLEMQINPTKQSIMQTFNRILKNEGVRAFWKGNGINAVKLAPEMALRFGVYDRTKQLFFKEGQPLTPLKRFGAASTAGLTSLIFIYPMEVFRTRIMTRKPGEFTGVFHAIHKIYTLEGMRAFYRGFISSVLGIIPYTGIDLTVYEMLRNTVIAPTGNTTPEAWKLIFCACTSITCGQLASYPFYLAKARQQPKIKHPSVIAAESSPGYCKTCKILKAIIAHDGFFGLYRGITLTLGKVLPAGVINYIVYEYARKFLTPYIPK